MSLRKRRNLSMQSRATLRRVIIKQGYLRKIGRRGSLIKTPPRRWFVFGVMNNTDPYLEYYESEEAVFTGSAINIFLLDTCKRISKKKSAHQKHVFTVVLADRDLVLIAETRTIMDEWCEAISQKLSSLNVLVEDDVDHVYVMNPVSRPLTVQQRETFYANRPVNEISCDRSQSARTLNQSQNGKDESEPQGSENQQEMYEATQSPAVPENSYAVPATEWSTLNDAVAQNEESSIFMEDTNADVSPGENNFTSANENVGLQQTTPTRLTSASWVMFGDREGHPIDAVHHAVQPEDAYLIPSELRPPVVSDRDFSLLTPKVREASGVGPALEDPSVVGWNSPPPDSDAPPLYIPHGALELGANRSLKHSQMEELQADIDNPGGVKIQLKRIDCLYAIAFVDCFKAVWIAGWNQRARPHLHNAFHIGDQVVSINGQVVDSAKMAKKLIKYSPENKRITFILKRLPKAKLLSMRRNYEHEDVGIRRNGGTAEIVGCDELGPAGHAGLTARTVTQSGDGFTSWWITEINNRPLNLFFKGDEIEKRLNAIGLDISAVVQPMDFILELRKTLKLYHNYKDFLVD